ncbi:MAG: hypothetical protein JXR83_23260 [Deltaproteobacteria bacterium]|nr:hypothetical protein [Deltaproteobacteria bacterium]
MVMKPATWSLLGACLLAVACDEEAPFFIDTLILSDTVDPVGPYTVSTVVVDNYGVIEVELDYQIGLPAAPIAVDCERNGNTDTWNCLIPGPRRSTRIYYSLTARDSAGKTARDPALAPDSYSFAVTAREPPPIVVDAGAPDRALHDAGAVEDRGDAGAATDSSASDRVAEDGGIEDSGGEDAGSEDAVALDRTAEDS